MGTHTPNPLPCGCRVEILSAIPLLSECRIVRCQLHSAAEAMLAALKGLVDAVEREDRDDVSGVSLRTYGRLTDARAALAKAGG